MFILLYQQDDSDVNSNMINFENQLDTLHVEVQHNMTINSEDLKLKFQSSILTLTLMRMIHIKIRVANTA